MKEKTLLTITFITVAILAITALTAITEGIIYITTNPNPQCQENCCTTHTRILNLPLTHPCKHQNYVKPIKK